MLRASMVMCWVHMLCGHACACRCHNCHDPTVVPSWTFQKHPLKPETLTNSSLNLNQNPCYISQCTWITSLHQPCHEAIGSFSSSLAMDNLINLMKPLHLSLEGQEPQIRPLNPMMYSSQTKSSSVNLGQLDGWLRQYSKDHHLGSDIRRFL
jgi:hypothetical protein